MNEHLNFKLVATRHMTRKLSELPRVNGFKFYGIGTKGKRYRCQLKNEGEEWTVYSSQAGMKDSLIGWQPTP